MEDKDWKKVYKDIKNQLLMDKVSDAIKKDPKNWKNNVEEIGFTWTDDSQDEIEEEKNAYPQNVNQEYLVAYFEEQVKFDSMLIEIFIKEIESETPNYPLFRKYFKTGNTRLVHLLISGLSGLPTNQVLLSGLGYFHENKNILSKIIDAYIGACKKEDNIIRFRELCLDFVNDTNANGYDAIAELKPIFQDNEEKLEIFESITKMIHDQDEVIEF